MRHSILRILIRLLIGLGLAIGSGILVGMLLPVFARITPLAVVVPVILLLVMAGIAGMILLDRSPVLHRYQWGMHQTPDVLWLYHVATGREWVWHHPVAPQIVSRATGATWRWYRQYVLLTLDIAQRAPLSADEVELLETRWIDHVRAMQMVPILSAADICMLIGSGIRVYTNQKYLVFIAQSDTLHGLLFYPLEQVVEMMVRREVGREEQDIAWMVATLMITVQQNTSVEDRLMLTEPISAEEAAAVRRVWHEEVIDTLHLFCDTTMAGLHGTHLNGYQVVCHAGAREQYVREGIRRQLP